MRLPAHYAQPVSITRLPKISLVTPSYKQAGFIERTINSVLDQDYPNLEYFVQDGGSMDGTREILDRYSKRLAGWESCPDRGQSQALNLGFAKTSGEIMAWLNSDDILLPGALAYVAEYFNRHPEVDVVYGHRILIDENDHQIGRWMLPAHDDAVLSWADYVPQETIFWRRRIWDKVGGRIDESFRFAMDWDLLVRFRDAGARFARLPRFLGGFRVHPQQKTSAAISEVGCQEMDRIRQRVWGRVPSRTEVRKAVLPYLVKHVVTDLGWQIRNKLGAPS
ncbi:MAG TPA: glycosyltransferase family 2 protein [Gammaproteobacteria bacterium]|nr:glycosyltransferase family 2 protein [Gammaproteobacteria bacterium]